MEDRAAGKGRYSLRVILGSRAEGETLWLADRLNTRIVHKLKLATSRGTCKLVVAHARKRSRRKPPRSCARNFRVTLTRIFSRSYLSSGARFSEASNDSA